MKRIAPFALALISFAACFAIGFSWRDLREAKLPTSETLGTMLTSRPMSSTPASAKQIFKDAYSKITKGYYRPVQTRELKYAGMQGLLGALGDPHTLFLEPIQAEEFALETGGNFVGIGARLSPDPLGARVAIVFKEGPAAKAGLRKGDLITSVDGATSAGKSVEDIVKTIRGKEGTIVRLMLVRKDALKPFTISVRRSQIIMPTVDEDMVPGTKIGYIKVSGFAQPTTDQFDRALDGLSKRGMNGLIIDVRDNGGGLLETAVDMLSRFVEDKVVVKIKGRDREELARTFFGEKRKLNFPIIVLMNQESASASEIFAGVLSDYKIATLVGEHTYGKASVQNVYGLIDGSSAKITIGRYFIPSGRDISRKVDEDGVYLSGGLAPDVAVEYRPFATQPGDESVVPRDSQIARAVEIIKSGAASPLR